jgi:hypothetical protein
MITINDIQELYDYRNSKPQNFSFNFRVVDSKNNLDRTVEVYATSLLVAKENLQNEIGHNFNIIEL